MVLYLREVGETLENGYNIKAHLVTNRVDSHITRAMWNNMAPDSTWYWIVVVTEFSQGRKDDEKTKGTHTARFGGSLCVD